MFCDKKPRENTLNILEMRPFWKSAIMQGYSLWKTLTLGQKSKFQKTYENPF